MTDDQSYESKLKGKNEKKKKSLAHSKLALKSQVKGSILNSGERLLMLERKSQCSCMQKWKQQVNSISFIFDAQTQSCTQTPVFTFS